MDNRALLKTPADLTFIGAMDDLHDDITTSNRVLSSLHGLEISELIKIQIVTGSLISMSSQNLAHSPHTTQPTKPFRKQLLQLASCVTEHFKEGVWFSLSKAMLIIVYMSVTVFTFT